jgi:hypothetical protein
VEEGYVIVRDDYEFNQDGFENYEQALIDKWVCVIHIYPRNEND